MRHRSEIDETMQAPTRRRVTHHAAQPGDTDRLLSLGELMATDAPILGKHRAAGPQQIPTQMLPTHDHVIEAAAPVEAPVAAPVEAPAAAHVVADEAEEAPVLTRPVLVPKQTVKPAEKVAVEPIPQEAQWRASHLPRLVAGGLLALAAVGTAGLGLRYAQTRTSDNFLSLVIGVVVVVVLWALVIVGTPQVVSLNGSILDIHNTGGSEHFDLSDGLQPVDVVGDPRTAHWAVLLHRPNGTTLVLRHHDVNALELDPIVRHYRNVANRHFAERQARFNL